MGWIEIVGTVLIVLFVASIVWFAGSILFEKDGD